MLIGISKADFTRAAQNIDGDGPQRRDRVGGRQLSRRPAMLSG